MVSSLFLGVEHRDVLLSSVNSVRMLVTLQNMVSISIYSSDLCGPPLCF